MAFSNTNEVGQYAPSPSPSLPGSERLYLERELRSISETINGLSRAVREIQDYLKTLP